MNQPGPQKPVRTFRIRGIKISIWENRTEDAQGKVIISHSATLQKSYCDKEGEWHDTDTLFVDDLLRIIVLAFRAIDWMEVRETSPAFDNVIAAVTDGEAVAAVDETEEAPF